MRIIDPIILLKKNIKKKGKLYAHMVVRVHTLKWDIWLPWIAQSKSSNSNIFDGRDIMSLVYLIIALRFSIIVRWFGWSNNTFFPFWLRFLVVLSWFWWNKILFIYFWFLIVLIGKQLLLIIMMMIIIRTLISTSRFKIQDIGWD